MKGKINEIKEVRPVETLLEDGFYSGIWGGYTIVINKENRTFELTTEEGVRGININVIVEVKEGIATFETTKN